MRYSLTWLAEVLREAGLKVIEQRDWKNHGRGQMGKVKGVLCHHTAGPLLGDHPSLGLVEKGRMDLPGPLSQLFLSRDGTFYVIGAGRCNHAGKGEWHGVTAGNTHFIGIEAENTGLANDSWLQAQMDAYARGVAAILTHIGADAVMCAGHKEYALPRGRKIDPTFDMMEFRETVANVMFGGGVKTVTSVDPRRAMLRKGDRGKSVKQLQKLLKISVDGNFGPQTEKAVREFQVKHGLTPDGLVGPKTWKELDDAK